MIGLSEPRTSFWTRQSLGYHSVVPNTSSDDIEGSQRGIPFGTIKFDIGVFSTRSRIRCARTPTIESYSTESWAPGRSSLTRRSTFSLAQRMINTFRPWVGRKGLGMGEDSGSVESWLMNRRSNSPARRGMDGEDLEMSPVHPSSISVDPPNWYSRG